MLSSGPSSTHGWRKTRARRPRWSGMLVIALYFGPTPVEEGIARCRDFLAELSGERTIEAAIWSSLAGLLAMRGDFDEARKLWAEASEQYEELGLGYRKAVRSTIGADIEALAGDAEAAERELRWGYETLEQMGEKGARAVVAAFLAEALAGSGRDDEAGDFVEIAAELAADDDLVPQALYRSVRAKLLARSGNADKAEELAREAAAMVEDTDFLELQAITLLSLGEVLEAAGKGEESAGLIDRARKAYEQKGNFVAARRIVRKVNADGRP